MLILIFPRDGMSTKAVCVAHWEEYDPTYIYQPLGLSAGYFSIFE